MYKNENVTINTSPYRTCIINSVHPNCMHSTPSTVAAKYLQSTLTGTPTRSSLSGTASYKKVGKGNLYITENR